MSLTYGARVLIQQCVSAKLVTNVVDGQPAANAVEENVQIGKGMVVYLCFTKIASEETVDKLISRLLKVKLVELGDGTRANLLDSKGDIMVVPQATLGGKLHGSNFQYHDNIQKEKGKLLYESLVRKLGDAVRSTNHLVSGTYGNRQVLSMITNGPFTHQLTC